MTAQDFAFYHTVSTIWLCAIPLGIVIGLAIPWFVTFERSMVTNRILTFAPIIIPSIQLTVTPWLSRMLSADVHLNHPDWDFEELGFAMAVLFVFFEALFFLIYGLCVSNVKKNSKPSSVPFSN